MNSLRKRKTLDDTLMNIRNNVIIPYLSHGREIFIRDIKTRQFSKAILKSDYNLYNRID